MISVTAFKNISVASLACTSVCLVAFAALLSSPPTSIDALFNLRHFFAALLSAGLCFYFRHLMLLSNKFVARLAFVVCLFACLFFSLRTMLVVDQPDVFHTSYVALALFSLWIVSEGTLLLFVSGIMVALSHLSTTDTGYGARTFLAAAAVVWAAAVILSLRRDRATATERLQADGTHDPAASNITRLKTFIHKLPHWFIFCIGAPVGACAVPAYDYLLDALTPQHPFGDFMAPMTGLLIFLPGAFFVAVFRRLQFRDRTKFAALMGACLGIAVSSGVGIVRAIDALNAADQHKGLETVLSVCEERWCQPSSIGHRSERT